MGSGSNDNEKYSPKASRETLDHSAMYIFAVALEDGAWHHEKSYSKKRKNKSDTIKLWRKIKTFESKNWNKKYYDEPNPLKKAQGAKVEIELMNGVKIIDQLEFANAHPNGKTPFGRDEYINKMKILANNIIHTQEENRFLDLINNLEKLKSNEIKNLNIVCKEKHLDLKKNNIKGIF
jgi:2-methylcitrate dehydratase